MNEKIRWFLLLVVVSFIISSSLRFGAYTRSDDISSVPCLGCLGLDPVLKSEFQYEVEGEHPSFALNALNQSVVVIKYRTDACSACDEMEPVVDELEVEYTEVKFIHINLDHASQPKRESYHTYDVKGERGDITGVPMFVIMTLDERDGKLKPYYKVLYGIYEKEELASDITKALESYPEKKQMTPMTELFVDTQCQYCPSAEESLVDLYDRTFFVSYVTDAPGHSGAYAKYLEEKYRKEDGEKGHPRAVFQGGVKRKIGTGRDVKDAYSSILSQLNLTPEDIDLTLSKHRDNGSLKIGYDLESRVEGRYHLKVMIVDRYSPWKNIEGEPIPFAFVDNAFNKSLNLDKDENVNETRSWDGTEKVDLEELGKDLGVYGILMKDEKIVQTAEVRPDVGRILIDSNLREKNPITPGENKRYVFNIHNKGKTKEDINITMGQENESWEVEYPSSLEVESEENKSIGLNITAPEGAAINSSINFTVHAYMKGKDHISDKLKITALVKRDSIFPKMGGIKVDPEDPRVGEKTEIRILAVDNEEIEKVNISYYVCTDKLCGPVKEKSMQKSGKDYTATVGPFDEKYSYLHFTVSAEDSSGNLNLTEEQEVIFKEEEETTPLSFSSVMSALMIACLIAYCREKRRDT